MSRFKWSFLPFVILIVCPCFVNTSKDSFIYDYNPETFKQQIELLDGNFIMFYAPWCAHCTRFIPIWQELAEMINLDDSKFAVAQVDCTRHFELCKKYEVTGYPTLMYFHKNSFTPVHYNNVRNLPTLSLFLSEQFKKALERNEMSIDESEVKHSMGLVYLNDHNIEKFVSKGQHFIMFYMPWCKASQNLSPQWALLGTHFADNEFVQIGKVNCLENDQTCKMFAVKQYPSLLWIADGRIMGESQAETNDDLIEYANKMLLSENHDPERFKKRKVELPVARISEDNFDVYLEEKDLVYVNYFAPWCAHCMQLSPLWAQLGERFMNETRVIIADIDCVSSKTVCETEKITSLPTLILYKHGKVVSVEHGGKPVDSLVALVNKHLGKESSEQTKKQVVRDEL